MYPSYSIGPGRITPAVKTILFINVGAFFLTLVLPRAVYELFALNPPMVIHGMVWQLVTYQFLHAGLWHIFWNMLMLYMFGVELEEIWGTKPFYTFYFICGIGAGIVQMMFSYSSVAVGASGALYGILIAYGLSFPTRVLTILLFLVVPVSIRALHLSIILIVITLFSAMSGAQSDIAHFAHLGGLFFGWLCVRFRLHYYDFSYIYSTVMNSMKVKTEKKRHLHLVKLDYDVDSLLDKISERGYESLTNEEKEFLARAGDKRDSIDQ